MPTQYKSQITYPGDGTTTLWPFSFANGYIDPSHVFVEQLVGGEVVSTTRAVLQSPGVVRLTPAAPVGTDVRIRRITPTQHQVDFTDRLALTEESLDVATKQPLLVLEEVQDMGRIDSVTTPVELPTEGLAPGKLLSTDGTIPVWTDAPVGLPDQVGHAGKVLVTDGTLAEWAEWQYPVIPPSLPSQVGQAGKYLRTNGITPSWEAVAAGDSSSVFKYMTDEEIQDVVAGTLTKDVTAAVLAAIAANKVVDFPAGSYRLSPITLTGVRGLILRGAGAAMVAGGERYSSNTNFVFDSAALGSTGLTFSDFVGLRIEDIVISMRRGSGANGSGGGTALYAYAGHDYELRNVKVDLRVGGGGAGIVLGGGNGETATFVGSLTNVKVFSHTSVAIKLNFGTSVTMTACYQVGGWFEFYGMTYFTVNSCASERAPDYYGYLINGCTNGVFNGCGAEGNARGAFYLSLTTSNMVFNAPYGAGNNTVGDESIGDLFHIDSSLGAVNNITINNPTSVAVHPNTDFSIFATAGTGRVDVNGEDTTLLPRPIGGNSSWMANKLTRTGDREVQGWTPALQSWSTGGLLPQVYGLYVKKGNVITVWLKITPSGGPISSTRPLSTITNLPFSPIASSLTQVDDNGNSYGAVAVGPTGIIYPQPVTNLLVPLHISGTIVIG